MAPFSFIKAERERKMDPPAYVPGGIPAGPVPQINALKLGRSLLSQKAECFSKGLLMHLALGQVSCAQAL